jgi:hypothetical protein
VIILYAIALAFYLIEMTTTALVFGITGFVVELAALIVWLSSGTERE